MLIESGENSLGEACRRHIKISLKNDSRSFPPVVIGRIKSVGCPCRSSLLCLSPFIILRLKASEVFRVGGQRLRGHSK